MYKAAEFFSPEARRKVAAESVFDRYPVNCREDSNRAWFCDGIARAHLRAIGQRAGLWPC